MSNRVTPCPENPFPEESRAGEDNPGSEPAAEQDAKALPRAWSGPWSDTPFTANFENDAWILGVRIDAETPIVIQSPFDSEETLESYADLLDFGLAVARNPDAFNDAEISDNALHLIFCRDFYRQNGNMIHDQIAMSRTQMDLHPDNFRLLRNNSRSAEAMCRISKRIDDALKRAVAPLDLVHIEAPVRGRLH